ncbi:MAG: response regulator [Ktedonobacteraceae bacterium]
MSKRIIVADDEPDISLLVSLLLRDYTVTRARCGEEALALIRQQRPDLAILDISMPDLSGMEVARALFADPWTASIPIIFLSALGEPIEIEAGLAVGVANYLVKPIEPDELLKAVNKLMQPVPSLAARENKHRRE